MRRSITHLVVLLLTFAIGVVASSFWGGFLAPSVEKANHSVISTSDMPVRETFIAPLRQNKCGCSQRKEKVSRTGEVLEQKAPIVSGGILNGQALSLPHPFYPSVARAAHATGIVTVQVLIDESGCVESARAIGGHPLLQAAAVEAAEQACFAPSRLSGEPVKVRGLVTYNFSIQ
jgi:TonB family protein